MNVILGTAFSLTLGMWRLRVRIAIEDTGIDEVPACACVDEGARSRA